MVAIVPKPEIIILEENCDGRGGYIAVDKSTLTEEFIDSIKKNKKVKAWWMKYHKILKEKGYDIG